MWISRFSKVRNPNLERPLPWDCPGASRERLLCPPVPWMVSFPPGSRTFPRSSCRSTLMAKVKARPSDQEALYLIYMRRERAKEVLSELLNGITPTGIKMVKPHQMLDYLINM